MTEIFLIEVDIEQKQTLLEIFKAFKVRFTPTTIPKTKEQALAEIDADDVTKAFYSDFIDAIEWSNANARGEGEKGQSLSSFLDELETELENEKHTTHAH